MTAKLSADELATYTDEDCKRDIGLLMGIATAMPDAAVFLAHVADQLKRSMRLTAQVREAEARWDKLEETVQQMFQRASGLENGHDLPFDDVLAEMARLERQCCERDHDFDGNCDRHPASLREPPPAREGSEG